MKVGNHPSGGMVATAGFLLDPPHNTTGTNREALSRIAIVKAFRALDRRLLSACGGTPTAGSDVLRAVCLPPDQLPLSVKFDTVATWPECN